MDDLQPIRNVIKEVLKIMAEREYAISTIKNHQGLMNTLGSLNTKQVLKWKDFGEVLTAKQTVS